MTAATVPQAPLRLVPALEPRKPDTLDRLAFQMRRMESEWLSRRGRRGLGRHVPVKAARDVLREVQDVVALVGLHLPRRHPTQALIDLIVSGIDHEIGRDPAVDYTPWDRQRMARVNAAIAAEATGGAL